jgi:alpha-tubulin suppressor-like RCC1 family protein
MADEVTIKSLATTDEVKTGDFLLIETDSGTRIINFKDFVIGQSNTTFQPLLSTLSYDTRELTTNHAALSSEIESFRTMVSDVSGLSGVVWTGDWSDTTSYEISEAVFYNDSSFIAKADNTGQAPIDSGKVVNGAYWDYLAKGTIPALSAKGDILVGTTGNTSKRLPAGPAGYVLKTRSTGDLVHWALPDNGRAGSVCSSLIAEDGNAQAGQMNYGMSYLMSNNTVKAVYGEGGSGVGYHPTGGNSVHWVSNPHPVTMPPDFDYDNDSIASIQHGHKSTFIVTSTGKVFATGINTNGQLGLADTTVRHIFVQVTFPDAGVKIDKVIISAPADFSSHSTYFLAKNDGTTNNDGRIYACGKNTYGQLGDGTTDDRSSPVRVGTLTGITNVWATGGQYGWVFASKATGQFYGWGLGGWNGRTGITADGANASTPTLQTGFAFGATTDGLHAVTKVIPVFGKISSAFHSSTLALLSSGHIYHQGDNAYYQGATASNADATTWTRVEGLSGVLDFDLAYSYRPTIIASCSAIEGGSYDGVKYTGHTDKTSLSGIKLIGWGFNASSELGLGVNTQISRTRLLNEYLPEPLRYAVKLGSVKLQTSSTNAGQVWTGIQDTSGNLYFCGHEYGGKFARGVNTTAQANSYFGTFVQVPMPCAGGEIKNWMPIGITGPDTATSGSGANMILTNDGRVFVAGNYVDAMFGAGYSHAEFATTPHDGWKQVLF